MVFWVRIIPPQKDGNPGYEQNRFEPDSPAENLGETKGQEKTQYKVQDRSEQERSHGQEQDQIDSPFPFGKNQGENNQHCQVGGEDRIGERGFLGKGGDGAADEIPMAPSRLPK